MGRWIVASAWPYAYSIPHLGNLIGAPLSADVFARFLRKMGEEVVFVSGSDEHGTPIEAEARRRGIHPRELTDEMHERLRDLFRRFGISYDNYTRTESPVHVDFVRDFYSKVYDNGYVFEREVEQLYCPNCRMFLPDRFVTGTCPYCGNPSAYGDQCDRCGKLLKPTDLIGPRCVFCGSTPVLRRTKHWFFDLPRFAGPLEDYVSGNERLPDNARNMSLAMIREGLEPRSLTRDNSWGIPAPFPGAEGKTIYVWMEAVLGYVSAVREWAEEAGDPAAFDTYWKSPDTRAVYFIGKDNIPFHVIILPALLMASGEGYVLPYNVASTEFLMYEGMKFSKSKGVGIWMDEALDLLEPDYWRYYLLATRPERKDANFSWSDFEEKINGELNDVLGNFVHRVLTFVRSRFGGVVPDGEIDGESSETLAEARSHAERSLEEMKGFRMRRSLQEVMEVARIGNRYLNSRAPWDQIRVDREAAAATIRTAVSMVKMLSVFIEPFLPFSAEKIWGMLALDGDVHRVTYGEAFNPVPGGHEIGEPRPLFSKVSREDLIARLEEIRRDRG